MTHPKYTRGLTKTAQPPRPPRVPRTCRYLHQRISRALAPELDEAAGLAAALGDWDEDSGGLDTAEGKLDFTVFANGMFGVAHM